MRVLKEVYFILGSIVFALIIATVITVFFGNFLAQGVTSIGYGVTEFFHLLGKYYNVLESKNAALLYIVTIIVTGTFVVFMFKKVFEHPYR